jgi:mono/diheme cytochrome c family protein
MRRTGLFATGLAAVMAASAALAAEPPRQPAGRPMPTPEALYRAKCAVCHSERGWASAVLARRAPAGQAALTERKGLRAAYIRQAVRRGVGAMPGFTPTDVTDAELAALAAWLER